MQIVIIRSGYNTTYDGYHGESPMNAKSILIMLLLACLLVGGVSAAHPSSYINPYAYEVRWIQQGVPPNNEQGVCNGAALSYILDLQRLEADGNQPTYTELPLTRNAWVNTSTFNATVDIPPPGSFSVMSLYHNFVSHHSNGIPTDSAAMMSATLLDGGNLESDWITAKNHMTIHYYPQTSVWLDAHRTGNNNCYENITGTRAEQWDKLKEAVYRNHVGLIKFNVTANIMEGVDGINFKEPSGAAIDIHYVAVVGYNETKSPEEIYILNSWGETMWGYDYPKIGGMTKTFWELMGGGASVPSR